MISDPFENGGMHTLTSFELKQKDLCHNHILIDTIHDSFIDSFIDSFF